MSTNLTRRSVAKGAAWSVPALTVGAPAAFAAASQACTSTSFPDAGFIDNGTAASSKYSQFKPSLKNACGGAVNLPAGVVVTVKLTNKNSTAGQYKSDASTGNYTTSGPTSYTSIGAGQTVTWTYTTTRAITAGAAMGMFAEVTNGDWVGEWSVSSFPSGYTDANSANNSITINVNS